MTKRAHDVEMARATLTRVMDALEDEPADDEEMASAIARTKTDVRALAETLRRTVAEFDDQERRERFAQLDVERKAEQHRLTARERIPLGANRTELEQKLRGLMKRVVESGENASIHFFKFEEATEAELSEKIAEVEHLIAARDDER